MSNATATPRISPEGKRYDDCYDDCDGYGDDLPYWEPTRVSPHIIDALIYYKNAPPLFTEEELEMLAHRITLTDGKSRVRMKTKELCDAIRQDSFIWDEVEECIRVARLESQIKRNNPSEREYHTARTYYDRTVKACAGKAEADRSSVDAIVLEVASNRWEKVQRLRQEHDDYFGITATAS